MDFAKISLSALKACLIGGGSILSLVPAIGPLVGGGIIAAGLAVNTGESSDQVSNAASELSYSWGLAQNMNASAYSSYQRFNVIDFIKRNAMIILIALSGIVLLIFIKKR